MGSLKLQSFEEFANASAKAAKVKLEEEQSAARNEAAYKFKTLLAEFGVTSIKDLNEEERNTFYRKLGASEISESIAIIEEGTRSQIGVINKRGKIESVYMHYDGYPDHMLPTIKKGYMNVGTVKTLLKKGGGSFLEADPSKINFYGDKVTMKGDAKDVAKYIKNAEYDGGAEYVYLYDERDGKWYMADTYDEPRELKPAFEHFIINERFVPSKGNLRDAKKVKKALEAIMLEASALTADEASHLGAVKYLLMYALEDANFHSYIEPVGKALKGGKIKTVMVTIDNLGGIEVPVGAKTISKFLDSRYSNLSSAAGWSGIGIVEGVALYLDGWGLSNQAQAIVDAFNLIYQNESVVNEGNAFLAARAKAIEEDAEEFEFNGKTYPVIKEDVNENLKSDIKTYQRQRKLGYGDQFHGDQSLSYTLSLDLGMDPDNEFGGGDWLGFDHVDLYVNGGKKEGTILDGALTGKYTYDDLKSAAAKFLGIKESVNEGDIAKVSKKEIMFHLDAFEKGQIEAEDLRQAIEEIIGEGNAFGAARAEAIAKGDDKFKVGDEEYDVEGVDAEDKENAEEYAEEEGIKTENEEVTEDEIEIKVDGDYEIEVEKEDEEESEESEEGGEEEEVAEEGVTNEAEVKSDEEFKEYAFSVLGQAFGDKFDEEKAQEVVDGLLDKHGDDYGAAVGALQSSLG